VLAVVGDLDGTVDGCTVWRVLQPFSELDRQGYPGVGWDYMDNPLVATIVHLYDAVILPRRHWMPEDWDKGRAWVDAMHKAGIAVLYEIDDDMVSDDFVNRLIHTHDKPVDKANLVRDCVLNTLSLVDGVTVSSQRLATILRQHIDKPIEVVPNFIDWDWFTAVQKAVPREVEGLTIGWAGGIRPDSDVDQMAIAWGRIARRFPDVTFVLQGHQAPIVYEHVPADRLRVLDWMPITEYPAGMKNIDIGCCPLSDTPFNRAKTFIKAMEYAAGGAAVVASPTVYGQIIEHKYDGFVCRTADEWEEALAVLVDKPKKRKVMARRLRRKVMRHHRLSENAWRWPVAWKRLIDGYRRESEFFASVGKVEVMK
jgi:glycosyltransferase involved in cell wall biosynthesis